MECKTRSFWGRVRPQCTFTISSTCLKWPSSELVVFGIRPSCSKVKRYFWKRIKLVNACLRFSWVQLCSPESGWIVFSFMKLPYFSQYCRSLLAKVTLSVSYRLLVNASNTTPASSSGFFVVPYVTNLSMCTIHIWYGMPQKPDLMPPNPSPVTDRILYPSPSSSSRHRMYTLVVSVSENSHHRSSCSLGSLATTEHHDVSSLRSPQYVPSTTRWTSLGLWHLFGARYLSKWSLMTRLSWLCSSLNSRTVCLLKTYPLQSSFSKVVFCLSLLLQTLWQDLQKYLCLPSWTPFLVTLFDWQNGQYLAFF